MSKKSHDLKVPNPKQNSAVIFVAILKFIPNTPTRTHSKSGLNLKVLKLPFLA